MKSILSFCIRRRQLRSFSSIPDFGPKPDENQIKSLLKESVSFDDFKEPTNPNNTWSTLPYTKETVVDGDLFQVKQDPSETSVILFPGQGSQYVGMTKDLIKFPAVKDLFEIANEVLGYDLKKLCLEGPESKLNKTVYAQPAIVVSSLAALEKLKEERPLAIENCTTTAGYSVGEITSLIFSGAIPFDRGIELIKIRANAMQSASEDVKGAMAMVFVGADNKLSKGLEEARNWCINKGIENPECTISAYLNSGGRVISGNVEAIEFLVKNLDAFKIKRVVRLKKLNGAFHSSLMKPAEEVLRKAIKYLNIDTPVINCYSNVTGKKYATVDQIKYLLPKQISRTVRWEQIMGSIYNRTDETFPRTFICGPESKLRGILSICNGKAVKRTLEIKS